MHQNPPTLTTDPPAGKLQCGACEGWYPAYYITRDGRGQRCEDCADVRLPPLPTPAECLRPCRPTIRCPRGERRR